MNRAFALMEALATFAFAAYAPTAAYGQLSAGRQTVVTKTITSTFYLNGGVGADEREAMRRVAGGFPLRMAFSEAEDGELVADVPVVISNENGNSVLELSDAGSLLYVFLPNGRYRVSARLGESVETQVVTLTGKGTKDLPFHWKGAPKK